jgi:hypothetical protein
MYGIYNTDKQYVIALTNRAFTTTMRRLYAEIHRSEFTDEEYLLSQYRPFHTDISHRFIRFDVNTHTPIKKIGITRNPYNRAYSSFLWFCRKGKYSFSKSEINYKLLFSKTFNTLNFENFLIFLNSNNPINAHLLPQTWNFGDFTPNLQLCKFSSLESTLTNFYVSLGYDFESTYSTISNLKKVQYNTSGIKKKYTEKREFSKLSEVELLKMEELPHLENMLTPQTEQLIYNYYRNDFEMLGYARYNISE